MHPFRAAVRPVFFLPDRDQNFQLVDQELSSFEGLVAMRSTDSHGNADITQFQMAQAMDYSGIDDRPFLPCRVLKMLHRFTGHLRIAFVVEGNRLPPRSHFTHGSQKQNDRPGLSGTYPLRQLMRIDRIAGQFDDGGHSR